MSSSKSISESEARMDGPMAVLFSYDPETEESTADPIVGLTHGNDPITWAYIFKESLEGVFPGRLWSITGNDEAQELRKAALMEAVLGPPTPRELPDPSGNSSANHHG